MVCKNCDRILSATDNFCNDCGAKVIRDRITINHLFTEFRETFFSWESNLPFRTFIDLLQHPEKVIGGYIEGVRKKYLNPYGFTTIAFTLAGIFFFFSLKFAPGYLDGTVANYGGSDAQMDFARNLQGASAEYHSLIFFAMIPLFALISYVVFYNLKQYNYAEHLILNLYVYSEVSILTFLIFFLTIWNSQIFGYVATVSIFFQIGYFAYVAKRLFRLTYSRLLVKTLFFLAIIIPIYILTVIIILFILYFTGTLNEVLESTKAENISYIASSFKNWTS